MALSPNYGWSEPDNTSLVKDGAQAMRTLGDAIDSTMATKAVAVNPVINSAMQVWQRGTSIAMTTTAYLADRWQGYRSAGGATASRQVTGDTTNLPFIQYCMRVQRDSGNASTNSVNVAQSFESINSIPFTGKTVTFSFYARRGANFSPTSNNLNVYLATGTGTDQSVIAGFTGNSYIVNTTAALTTTWTRYTYTATVGTSATQLATYFVSVPTGTAGANDYFEVTGVQVDIGSVALPFRTYAGTIQGELAACQRYYQRFAGSSPNPGAAGYGYAQNTVSVVMSIPPLVPMRITPSAVDFATLLVQDNLNNLINVTAVTIETNVASPSCFAVNLASASGYTAGRTYRLLGNASTAYVGFNAEL